MKIKEKIPLYLTVDRFYGIDELHDRESLFIREYSSLSNVTRTGYFQRLERLESIVRDVNRYKRQYPDLEGAVALEKKAMVLGRLFRVDINNAL